jgi:hypothetical protein
MLLQCCRALFFSCWCSALLLVCSCVQHYVGPHNALHHGRETTALQISILNSVSFNDLTFCFENYYLCVKNDHCASYWWQHFTPHILYWSDNTRGLYNRWSYCSHTHFEVKIFNVDEYKLFSILVDKGVIFKIQINLFWRTGVNYICTVNVTAMRRFVASPSVRKPQNLDYFSPVYIGILFLRNDLSTAHVHVMSTKRRDQYSYVSASGCLAKFRFGPAILNTLLSIQQKGNRLWSMTLCSHKNPFKTLFF